MTLQEEKEEEEEEEQQEETEDNNNNSSSNDNDLNQLESFPDDSAQWKPLARSLRSF